MRRQMTRDVGLRRATVLIGVCESTVLLLHLFINQVYVSELKHQIRKCCHISCHFMATFAAIPVRGLMYLPLNYSEDYSTMLVSLERNDVIRSTDG